MPYGAYGYGSRGYGDGEGAAGWAAVNVLDLGTGTSSWVWSSTATGPDLIMQMTGTSSWTWSTSGQMSIVALLTGTSEWTWGSSGYMTVPVPVLPPPGTTTVTTTAPVITGATTIPITTLTESIPAGTVLTFSNGQTAVVTQNAYPGATTLIVTALTGPIPGGATATTAYGQPATPGQKSIEDNARMIEHVYRVYDPFTLVHGQPDPASTFVETRADWGRYMIEVGGADVTFLRGRATSIRDIEWQEPYDDARVSLIFAQVTCLENFGDGDTAMLSDHVEIRVWRILPNGTKDTEPEFEGWVSHWGHAGNFLAPEGVGVLHQIDLLVRAPGITDIPDDIGTLVPFQWNTEAVPSYLGAPMASIVTGVMSRDRGAWDQGRLNYVDRQLKRAVLSDGRQYTIKKRYPMQGYMVLKDTDTINFTLQPGIPGLDISGLQRDLTTDANVWYAEGEDEAGTRWRNSFPTADGLSVFFQPLSYLDAVHPYDEGPNGTLILNLARLNTNIFRIEKKADFGQGWNKVEAKRVLDGMRARMATDGSDFFGDITLNTDPPQMSRRKIRPGMNFTMPHHGPTPVKFHVSAVKISDPQGRASTTLTVDTRARDIDEITSAIERKANEVSNPVRALLVGRESALVQDKVQPWDSTRGDGWVPRQRYFDGVSTFVCPQKKYAVQRFTIGEEEIIIKTRIELTSGTIYHASLCDRPPKGMDPRAEYFAGVLADWPSDPVIRGAWEPPALPQPPVGQIMAWGSYGQMGGYSSGTETNPTSGVTGVIESEQEWNFTHANVPREQRQPTYGWLVIWCHNQSANAWAHIERVKRAA